MSNDEENLNRLITKRAAIRGHVTKKINGFYDSNEKDLRTDLIACLKSYNVKLNELNDKIHDFLSEDKLENDLLSCLEYEDKILVLVENFGKSGNNSKNFVSSGSKSCNIKLPKLQIKPFTGDILQWRGFYESFYAAIHKNDNLCDTEKYIYLLSFLSGDALQCVKGLECCEDSYMIALDILKAKFGRSDCISHMHIQNIQQIKPCTNNTKHLRKFIDDINIHLRSLKNLGVDYCKIEIMLVPLLIKKLPKDIVLQLSRANNAFENFTSLEYFLDVLENEIRNRENVERFCDLSVSNDENKNCNIKDTERNFSASALVSLPSTSNSKSFKTPSSETNVNRYFCVFCDDNTGTHSSKYCKKFEDLHSRKQKLIDSKRCLKCLKLGHFTKSCNGYNCSCGGQHNISICPSLFPKNKVLNSVNNVSLICDTVVLQTAKLDVSCGNNQIVSVNVLFDSGSQHSYISKDAVLKLKSIPLKNETMNVSVFGGSQTKKLYPVHNIILSSKFTNESKQISVFEIETICNGLRARVDINSFQIGLDVINDFSTETKIDLLVGMDLYWDLVTGKSQRVKNCVIVETLFGWMLSGRVCCENSLGNYNSTSLSCFDNLEQLVERFWAFESLGTSFIETDVITEFSENIILKDNGFYEVSLPWNSLNDKLPTNSGLALNRLFKLKIKLKRNPDLLKNYHCLIKDQLDAGLIEEIKSDSDVGHYIPHQAVIREDKATTKLRIVYDGSAKSCTNSVSINDCLQKGQCLLPLIFDMLLKFRGNLIAFTSDIKQAFLQILIEKNDCEFLKFYWFRNPVENDFSIVVYRFNRLIFGLTCSPFILNAVLKYHLSKSNTKLFDVLTKCYDIQSVTQFITELCSEFYVDDLLSGTQSVENAVMKVSIANDALSLCNMALCKWTTNSKQLRNKCECFQKTDSVTKVLGVHWDADTDSLFIVTHEIVDINKIEYNKAFILSCIAKIFDPLGILCAYIITAKILFQKLCLMKINWTSEITENNLRNDWKKWLVGLIDLSGVRIPRCYFSRDNFCSSQLHGFCDASENAYGAVVFVRHIDASGNVISVVFVAGKSRVAPLKKQTIPRLELLSCLLLASLIKNVLKSIMFCCKTFLWSDSSTALTWIKVYKEWNQFVMHRVNQIRLLTRIDEWNFIPGKLNPADSISRGIDSSKLKENDFAWFDGPLFLKDNVLCSFAIQKDSIGEAYQECKKIKVVLNISSSEDWIDLNRFSTFDKLINTIAFILRFAFRDRKQSLKISCSERTRAINFIIFSEQKLYFDSVFKNLQNHRISELKNLTLSLNDDKLLCSEGRFQYTKLQIKNKLIIVPFKSQLAKLIVLDVHESVLHSGVAITLSQIRNKYWIPRARQLVKKLINRCIKCRKLKGTTYKEKPIAPIQDYRVAKNCVFQNVGIDFGGPVILKRDKLEIKSWFCLFTCAVSRAVHLELVLSLDVNNFLMALRRFIGRRGMPILCVTDNALNFKHVGNIVNNLYDKISKIHNDPSLQQFLVKRNCKWLFIVERSPWWGGFYERLVGLTKEVIKKKCGKGNFNICQMQTILVETEAILNSRPLTYLDDDASSDALTPAHFLIQKPLLSFPAGDEILKKPLNVIPVQYWLKLRNQISKVLWLEWKNVYLNELREHDKRRRRLHGEGEPSVGDVVLVHDRNLPRLMWKMAIILEVFNGRDGHVRSCKIKMTGGKGGTYETRRAISLLYPLELRISS